MNNRNAFITGNSGGLGYALSQVLLEKDYRVFGCSRRGCDLNGDLVDVQCDLGRFEAIPLNLSALLKDTDRLDLVILNAGMLGEIKAMQETSVEELQNIMDINVWSNKVVLDWLLHADIDIDQIVFISSGAAVLGSRGWGGYAISKASLNMLAKLYAHEFVDTHLSAIAPGLVDTDMMAMLGEGDANRFPALQRIQEARGTERLLTPREAAERIIDNLDALKSFKTGSFVDLRQILEPDEYEQLMSKV